MIPEQQKMATLQAALNYAELGYRVFPCMPDRKEPATPHGCLDATTDPEQIEAWWTSNPQLNVAIATDGLCVVDVDPDGRSWLEQIDERDLMRGAVATTPRDGLHCWFRQNGGPLRNTAGRIAKGVDTRADGGYVLVFPSVVNGRPYRWTQELDVGPDSLPEVPNSIVDQLGDKPRLATTEGKLIPEGQRNQAMMRFAGLFRRGGMTAAEILEALEAVNTSRCQPPLPAKELQAIAQSAARYQPDIIEKLRIHAPQAAVPEITTDTLAANIKIPPPIEYERMTAAELATGDFETVWLIEDIMADQQPGIISGRFKTLKTTILMALALALATARKFLGKFWVPRPVSVGIFSGESGKSTLQETGLRVARSMGVNLADVSRLIISTTLPKIGRPDHHQALERYITDNELEVVFIDPSYLAMPDVADAAGNLFAVGALLTELTELSQRTGCAFWICNHNKRAKSFEVPELGDVAWAGFSEWARQWLLLGKRCEWDPDEGRHWLWMVAGGSAGHGAVYGLDVVEGKLKDEGGRRWEVEVLKAGDAIKERARQSEQEKSAERERRWLAAVAEAREGILKALTTADDHREVKTGLQTRSGHKGKAFDAALGELLREGELIEVEITKGNNRSYDGYQKVYRDNTD